MRVLLLNQTFHPDLVATAQYLTDLAVALRAEGHEVTALTGARGYDDVTRRFPREEVWNGIRLRRVRSLWVGKHRRWQRAVDFGSYVIACAVRLAALPRADVVVALTSPPLISFLAAVYAKVHRARFVFWVMDLNPDEAVAAGWLSHDSLAGRALQWALRYSLHAATRVVVLDRYMRDAVLRKNVLPDRVSVLPPWSHDDFVAFDAEGRKAFRQTHGLDDAFVVMYAGNHSPCNPLDTVLAAAGCLRDRDDIRFCFVGGGSVYPALQAAAASKSLRNVVFLPYQPREGLGAALSAADLHLITLGDPFVGLISPSKIYNILRVGSPFLYVGPRASHVADIVSNLNGGPKAWCAAHGEVDGVVAAILEARACTSECARATSSAMGRFSQDVLLPLMLAEVVGNSERANRTSLGVSEKNTAHVS